ncbi:MAG: aspartate aminotransferase family protein [Clostridiales bacterium 43-6]|nr:MAG: aspartate aminotransferase family protein [Clostridiales bacterium 43-6]
MIGGSILYCEIINKDKKYHIPAYARYNLAIGSGKGAKAYDVDGREFIDFTSGIGVNSLGYSDKGWAKAVAAQAGKLQHVSNLYFSPVTAELAEVLCEQTDYAKAFFCNSGAEANECAIKIARKYSFDKYGPGRNKIITLNNSFHGRTLATLTATGQNAMHNWFFPFAEGFDYAAAGDIGELIKKADNTTCGVILEIIQGEGGVVPLSGDYLEEVAALCRAKDILLIIDEVQTGVGRTGRFLAAEHYGIQADITTLAKGLGGGLPIGACLCKEFLGNVLSAGTHGTTFGGNPVACAGALYVMQKIGDPEFLDLVETKGSYMREKITYMPGVKSVRGMGLMIGIELENGVSSDIAKKCIDNGLIVLTAKSLLRLLPPLNISYKDINKGLSLLNAVLSKNTGETI